MLENASQIIACEFVASQENMETFHCRYAASHRVAGPYGASHRVTGPFGLHTFYTVDFALLP